MKPKVNSKDAFTLKLLTMYGQLKPFYEKTRHGKAEARSIFLNCIRASFAKAYEFNTLINNSDGDVSSFFLTPALRSICEDLILLRYASCLSEKNRNELMLLLMSHEVQSNLKVQHEFFSNNRPFQSVLKPGKDYKADIDNIIRNLQQFWKKRGWRLNGNSTMPQIRQLAEKRRIESLYDFMYRLTCDVVHFNPQVLFRSGWGDLPEEAFSTKNFEAYYRAFATIYGSYLFCIYFELLGKHLNPGKRVKKIVQRIRDIVNAQNRWPELITYEEMNISRPRTESPILQVLAKVIYERENPSRVKRFLLRKPKPAPAQP